VTASTTQIYPKISTSHPGDGDPDGLLNEAQTSLLLCLSVRTLQGWRLRGGGPVYVKTGRSVRYRRRDLIDWIEAQTVHSTSQNV